MDRATQRPPGFVRPAYWSDAAPPAPAAGDNAGAAAEALGPTRYGDWVKDGIAVDF